MKQLFFVAVMLFALINTKAIAQEGRSTPIRYNQTNYGWWEFNNDIYQDDTLHQRAPKVQRSVVYLDSELVSAHLYTVTGTAPVAKVKTTRLDTIKLFTTKFKAGQTVWFVTTTSANDSTCFIPNSGLIQGGAFYWWTGAAGTYKSGMLYYDGTNWYFK